jgi:MFS family permease
MSPMAPDAAAVRRGVLLVAATVTVVVLMFSLLNPVLAVRLQRAGTSAGEIGFFLMLPFAAIGLSIPLLPRVLARVGLAPAMRAGLALEFAATLVYGLTLDFRLWCLAAFASGLGAAAVWNGTEALIAHHAPRAARGRWMGLYQSALGLALALGPFLPGLLALAPESATWVACGGLALGLALLMAPPVGRLGAAMPGRSSGGILDAARRHPLLVWAAFVGGVFEAGLGAITAAYGSQLGLTLAMSTSIAGVLGFGSFALQYPTGWLADRRGTRGLLVGAAVLLALASLPLAWAVHSPLWLWPAAALWGAVGGALYTLTMIRVAHTFADEPGGGVVAGTAAVIAGYTAGGAAGPLLSGALLDHAGPAGASTALVLVALSVGALALRRR